MSELKITELGKSYWNNNGIYQSEFDKLTKELMPASGMATTLNGELIRAVNRLFHEYCNNGNLNAYEAEWETEEETCHSCDGSGVITTDDDETDEYSEEDCEECFGSGYHEEEVEGDTNVSEMYMNFLNLISNNIPDARDSAESVEELILQGLYGQPKYQFSPENYTKYNLLTDKVVHYVLNNEDKSLPANYDN